MSIPDHIRQLLLLYDSNELSTIERQQVDAWLRTNAEVQEELALIRKLHRQLQDAGQFEPEEATLKRLRANLNDELLYATQAPSWWRNVRDFFDARPRWAWQLGFATAMLFVGILIGRQFFSRTQILPAQSPAPSTWLTATEAPVTTKSATTPQMASVHRIHLDPVSGQIEIEFSTVNNVSLRGTMSDPAIRQALAHTMREQEQTGLRLKAVKAVNQTSSAAMALAQGDDLTEALLYVLAHDANDGVRLKALAALKNFVLTPTIKSALIQALLRDANPAVRIEALAALNRVPLDHQEASAFEAAAASDSNTYIRLEAKRLLQNMQSDSL